MIHYEGRTGEVSIEGNPEKKIFADWQDFCSYAEKHFYDCDIKILFWNTPKSEADRIAKERNGLVAKLNSK